MSKRRGTYWLAAVTKFREELRAASHVERQGFEYYLPHVNEFRSGRYRPTLMFEGYIFVKLEPGWRVLSSTRGISRLIVQGDEPRRIRDEEIQQLRVLEDEDGIVRLHPRFSRADRVLVGEGGGGFKGLAGIVQGTSAGDRVKVLLQIMGRPAVGDFDSRSLTAA